MNQEIIMHCMAVERFFTRQSELNSIKTESPGKQQVISAWLQDMGRILALLRLVVCCSCKMGRCGN
jgi:hypothetical protein